MHSLSGSWPSQLRRALFVTCAAITLAPAIPAYAAMQPDADVEQIPNVAAAEQTAQSGAERSAAANTLQDIVVTAQRRTENLQRSSVAISVLSADSLNRAGMTGAAALSTIAPGVQIGGNGAFTQCLIQKFLKRSNILQFCA